MVSLPLLFVLQFCDVSGPGLIKGLCLLSRNFAMEHAQAASNAASSTEAVPPAAAATLSDQNAAVALLELADNAAAIKQHQAPAA